MNIKNLAMWAIIVFLTIGLYNMFKNPQPNARGGDKIIFSGLPACFWCIDYYASQYQNSNYHIYSSYRYSNIYPFLSCWNLCQCIPYEPYW